jgi:hypothetical protein
MALLKYFRVAQGAAGTVVVAAAIAGQKHKVLGLSLSLAATGSFRLTGAADLTGDIRGLKDNAITWPTSALPYAEADPGADLSLVTIGGGAQGMIVFLSEP